MHSSVCVGLGPKCTQKIKMVVYLSQKKNYTLFGWETRCCAKRPWEKTTTICDKAAAKTKAFTSCWGPPDLIKWLVEEALKGNGPAW